MFFDDIAKILDIDGATPNTFKITITNNAMIELFGQIKILSCSSVKIELAVNKQSMTILGENIKIKSLTNENLVLLGTFFGIINPQHIKT